MAFILILMFLSHFSLCRSDVNSFTSKRFTVDRMKLLLEGFLEQMGTNKNETQNIIFCFDNLEKMTESFSGILFLDYQKLGVKVDILKEENFIDDASFIRLVYIPLIDFIISLYDKNEKCFFKYENDFIYEINQTNIFHISKYNLFRYLDENTSHQVKTFGKKMAFKVNRYLESVSESSYYKIGKNFAKLFIFSYFREISSFLHGTNTFTEMYIYDTIYHVFMNYFRNILYYHTGIEDDEDGFITFNLKANQAILSTSLISYRVFKKFDSLKEEGNSFGYEWRKTIRKVFLLILKMKQNKIEDDVNMDKEEKITIQFLINRFENIHKFVLEKLKVDTIPFDVNVPQNFIIMLETILTNAHNECEDELGYCPLFLKSEIITSNYSISKDDLIPFFEGFISKLNNSNQAQIIKKMLNMNDIIIKIAYNFNYILNCREYDFTNCKYNGTSNESIPIIINAWNESKKHFDYLFSSIGLSDEIYPLFHFDGSYKEKIDNFLMENVLNHGSESTLYDVFDKNFSKLGKTFFDYIQTLK